MNLISKPKLNKNLFSIFIIISITIVLLLFFFDTNNPYILKKTFKTINKIYLAEAVFCMLAYWFLESFSLYMFSRKLAPNFNFISSLQTSMLGQMFNCITPFASGGQPVQVYNMYKLKVPVGISTSILLAKFILYQTILTLYSALILIFKYNSIYSKLSGFSSLVFIGFTVNLFVVMLLLCFGFFPKITKTVILKLLLILEKLRIIKDKRLYFKKIDEELSSFYSGFKLLKNHVSIIIYSTVIIFLQLTMLFLVPYFICLALNKTNVDIYNIISSGAFVLMISSFIPIPGASGGAEGSFYLFFSHLLGRTTTLGIAILLWRFITYYLTIFVGIFFVKPLK